MFFHGISRPSRARAIRFSMHVWFDHISFQTDVGQEVRDRFVRELDMCNSPRAANDRMPIARFRANFSWREFSLATILAVLEFGPEVAAPRHPRNLLLAAYSPLIPIQTAAEPLGSIVREAMEE
jgi:hypothetical protein